MKKYFYFLAITLAVIGMLLFMVDWKVSLLCFSIALNLYYYSTILYNSELIDTIAEKSANLSLENQELKEENEALQQFYEEHEHCRYKKPTPMKISCE